MKDTFTATGSRVYAQGAVYHNSDHDYIVNPKVTWPDGDVMNGLLRACYCDDDVTEREEFSTCSYDDARGLVKRPDMERDIHYVVDLNHHGPTINLIFVANMEEYATWLYATYALKSMQNGRSAKRLVNKEARIAAFHAAQKCFMLMMPKMEFLAHEDRMAKEADALRNMLNAPENQPPF